ncbi:hypothetical protein [Vibrio sp. WXL103]|uniref:hypothetical protein n=1 Tax=Vibrio sp. WXL103 TaxID=3450710 RepID=UPI003EC5BBE8
MPYIMGVMLLGISLIYFGYQDIGALGSRRRLSPHVGYYLPENLREGFSELDLGGLMPPLPEPWIQSLSVDVVKRQINSEVK